MTLPSLSDLYPTRADHCADEGHDLPTSDSRHPDHDNVCRRCGEET